MKKTITTYKKPLIGGALLLVLLLGYFTRDKWMAWLNIGGSVKNYNNGSSTNKTSKPSSSNTIDKTRVLRKGDKGASVKELQGLLNQEYDYQKTKGTVPVEPKLVVDGIFGAKTQAMLMLFTGKTNMSINDLVSTLSKQKTGALGAVDYGPA